ncbi:transcriptional regulatory protein [Clostridium tetani]|uniref:sigma-54 interaction domain-containing protein n=1 Tax=Clostridium tetani TaxID=1513 RepID=UPI000E17D3BA|nr:sigma 54-interacting transcriptional regulator [Clostridium tetani]WFN62526.1 sigma 54-interacting transcriptional regulator [Clostridium tetani]BDR77587.1 sigma-54-dependent Fis family transcriptional regulator [Clostridium tetani]BDR83114.1 sigma-54-dependent Fis family transcriptional regulator [Clostridium tetani]SUY54718.1 transcriptional regulatory protein [Clostridium tetani]
MFLKVNKYCDYSIRVGAIIINNLGEIQFMSDECRKILCAREYSYNHIQQLIPCFNMKDLINSSTKRKIKLNNKKLNMEVISLKEECMKEFLITLIDANVIDVMYEELKAKEKNLKILSFILELAYDGLVVIDKYGYITMINKTYADFLGVDQERSIGKHVTEVIESTRMHIVAKTGIAETAQLQKVKGKYMIANRIPVIENGELVAVAGKVLFKNIKELDLLYKKIRNIENEYKKYKGQFDESNSASYSFDNIIGKSDKINKTKDLAKKAAKTNSNVLIRGESGTGKELFAHAIHMESERVYGNFIKLNCAAIPRDLLESELFGYEGGAFTGAKKEGKIGKFELADGGTIFLDEIGDMPLHMQAKLLRVLQEREVERIGATRSKKIDVRVISATNRDLEKMIKEGEFREDLYYRLNVVTVNIPPLRERREDIKILSEYLLEKISKKLGKKTKSFSKEAMSCLMNYKWEGGVRQLENIIERAVNLVEHNEMIEPKHFPGNIVSNKYIVEDSDLNKLINQVEKDIILETLIYCNWNKTLAAKKLNISRTSLYEKIAKHNIAI